MECVIDEDTATRLNKSPGASTLEGTRGQPSSQTLPNSVEWEGPKICAPFLNRKQRRRLGALERQRPPRPQPRPASKKHKKAAPPSLPPMAPATPPPARQLQTTDPEYVRRVALYIQRAINQSGLFCAILDDSFSDPWSLVVMDPNMSNEEMLCVSTSMPAPNPRLVALVAIHHDRVTIDANSQRQQDATALRELVQHAVKGPAAAKETLP